MQTSMFPNYQLYKPAVKNFIVNYESVTTDLFMYFASLGRPTKIMDNHIKNNIST